MKIQLQLCFHQKASDREKKLVSPQIVFLGAGLYQGSDGGVEGEGLPEHQDGHQHM